MKKYYLAVMMVGLLACNTNSGNTLDSVEKADSTNKAKQAIVSGESKIEKNTSKFLVKAADDGMSKVEAAKIAEAKAVSKIVRDFASEIINDHNAIAADVRSLASKRTVALPATPGEDNLKRIADLQDKKSSDFDKFFLDRMISDHKKLITLFRDTNNEAIDPAVKAFITATIPALESHLAKAAFLRKTLW